MKNYIFTLVVVLGCTITALGQNTPSLLIDNVSTQFSNVSLPYWLKAGQTIDIGTNAKSVSILEFTVNGTALEFSQAVALTSSQTVPANKVWKIEGIGLIDTNTSMPSSSTTLGSSTNSVALLPTIFQSPKKFETPGSYNWKVPPGVTSICIEVWGAGGGGGPNGRGGGGGYGYQCFTVVPLTNFIVNVGTGGNGRFSEGGGSSSVGNLITAFGGDYSGGSGGTSTSSNGTIVTINGESSSGGGAGGNGGNGGIDYYQGNNFYSGDNGVAPGGGGGYGSNRNQYCGGIGARGQVYIYW